MISAARVTVGAGAALKGSQKRPDRVLLVISARQSRKLQPERRQAMNAQ